MRRFRLISVALGAAAATAAAFIAATASATSPERRRRSAAARCTIGMVAPITGPPASIGQRAAALGAVLRRAVERRTSNGQLKLDRQGDTQLESVAPASTVAQQVRVRHEHRRRDRAGRKPGGRSRPRPTPEARGTRVRLGSATRRRPDEREGVTPAFFFRVVPNDDVQGPTDAAFMMSKLNVKKVVRDHRRPGGVLDRARRHRRRRGSGRAASRSTASRSARSRPTSPPSWRRSTPARTSSSSLPAQLAGGAAPSRSS